MPTDDLTEHPLYPHVRQWQDDNGIVWWCLGERRSLWKRPARFREEALQVFLDEMTAHEVLAMIRELGAGRPQC